MTEFILTPGLDEITAHLVAPEVRKIAEKLRDTMRRNAPGTKRWVTIADPLVRATHVATNNQEVPENVKFEVPSMAWDIANRGVGAITFMDHPGDAGSGAIANTRNCRCVSVLNPAAIAEKIKVGPTEIIGPLVRIRVYAEGYKIEQAEFGDEYDFDRKSEGTGFMRKSVAAMVARA